MFAVWNVDAMVGSGLTHGMVVYFLKHLIHFCFRHKPVDTCFCTRTTSGIFNFIILLFILL
jgi:hypothetical protein